MRMVDTNTDAEVRIGSKVRSTSPITKGRTRPIDEYNRPTFAILVCSAGFTKVLFGLQSRIVQRANGRWTPFGKAIGEPAIDRCEEVVEAVLTTNLPNR